jgi:hypothetical protein
LCSESVDHNIPKWWCDGGGGGGGGGVAAVVVLQKPLLEMFSK